MAIATPRPFLLHAVWGQPALLLMGTGCHSAGQLSLCCWHHISVPGTELCGQGGLARFVMSEIWFRVQHRGNQTYSGVEQRGLPPGEEHEN